MQLTPQDLYRLRRARILVQHATLRAQYAQQQMEELTLELERSYGILTRYATLDMQTGRIQVSEAGLKNKQPDSPITSEVEEEVAHGPADNAD